MSRVVIEAGSRLHAGFHLVKEAFYRIDYAGAGFYSEQPRVLLEAVECGEPRIDAPDGFREVIKRVMEKAPVEACVSLLEAPPLHHGYGATTQVALATYHALMILAGRNPTRKELVEAGLHLLGRQEGSTVGTILYAYGGFTIAPGVPAPPSISPVILPIPADWRLVIVQPELKQGLHGPGESRVLKSQPQPSERIRYVMSRGAHLLLVGVMRRDLSLALDGLRLIQTATGQYFSKVQGGAFRSDLARLVDEAQRDGIFLAQSSWGPTLYTIAPSDSAESDAKTLRLIASLAGLEARVTVSRPRNRGGGLRGS
ncbi:MAG: hypothetical protein F7C33_03735 [Desulfurococcales archaeon]|nr:hypothetical protein [Desulfurococcales archaeon]